MAEQLGRICEFCDEVVWPDTIAEHYNVRHPGEDWYLAVWPDGLPALIPEEVRCGP